MRSLHRGAFILPRSSRFDAHQRRRLNPAVLLQRFRSSGREVTRNLHLLAARQMAQIAIDRLDDEAPLRLLAYFAERPKLVARVSRQAKTDLRIVLHSLTVDARRWASDSSDRRFSFRASRHTHLRFVLATTFDRMEPEWPRAPHDARRAAHAPDADVRARIARHGPRCRS